MTKNPLPKIEANGVIVALISFFNCKPHMKLINDPATKSGLMLTHLLNRRNNVLL